MYSIKQLKPKIKTTKNQVECPIIGCDNFVDRRTRNNNEGKFFVCKEHHISITPTTYIYENLQDNMINQNDLGFLEKIFKTKRESRLKNENSEDAVSWNVFRYLETENLLLKLLNIVTDDIHKETEIMYWSYCNKEEGTYELLQNARNEYGELENQGSEPDIIIKTDKTIFFIEAKLFSSNKTSGYGKTLIKRIGNKKNYLLGGNRLFSEIFSKEYDEIVNDQKYELLRFWLLGCWMAKEKNLNFHLINLVLERKEKNIKTEFGKHINLSNSNKFSRFTWESIYYFIKVNGNESRYKENILNYFENKAAGYNSSGKIGRKAFDV